MSDSISSGRVKIQATRHESGIAEILTASVPTEDEIRGISRKNALEPAYMEAACAERAELIKILEEWSRV